MYPDDRPRAFHSVLLRPNETQDQRPSTLKIKTRMFSVVATKCSVRCIAWLGLGVGTCMGPKHLSKQPTRKRAAQTLNAKIHPLIAFPSPLMDYTRKWTADIVALNKKLLRVLER